MNTNEIYASIEVLELRIRTLEAALKKMREKIDLLESAVRSAAE